MEKKNSKSINTEKENDLAKDSGESRINSQHPNPNKQDPEDIYPQSSDCSNSKMITEGFRIDDNSGYSTTANEENKCMNTENIPGVGLEDTDIRNEIDKNKKDRKK